MKNLISFFSGYGSRESFYAPRSNNIKIREKGDTYFHQDLSLDDLFLSVTYGSALPGVEILPLD